MTFDVARLLDDRSVRVVVACGTGGVGKTSISAALALRAADSGRKVVLLTVDPAKRLATALGLDELGSAPEPVTGVDDSRGGSLDALMLDMTRTFDEALATHAPREAVAQVRDNPFYRALSTSFSGTQDYMATEKVGQLYDELTRTGRWDLVVVDTPPSRSALDFLDSPERLDRLADGPLMQILAPRGALKLLGGPISQATRMISKVVGGQALADLQVFATAFEKVMGGFRQRADRVRRVLRSPETAFVIVSTPRRAALQEAAFFAWRLTEGHHRNANGLVVNRMATPTALDDADIEALASAPAVRTWWERANAQRVAQEASVAAYAPTDIPIRLVGELPTEVTDLESVRLLSSRLVAGAPEQDEAPALDV